MASGAAMGRAEGAEPLVAWRGSVQELLGNPDEDLSDEEDASQAGGVGACASAPRRGLSTGLLCAMGGACVYAVGRHFPRGPLRAGVQGTSGLESEGPSEKVTEDKTIAEATDDVDTARSMVDWRGATWVKGDEGENCEDACVRFGLTCYESEDSWPQQMADVSHIAEGLGLECRDHVSAENTYDPFVVGPFCSFGPWKPPNVWAEWRPRNVRSCKAAPPKATTRLCPCVQEIPEKGCQECDADCWRDDSCCEAEEDGCAPDPMLDKKYPDYDWWGAAVNWEWGGVDPDSEFMEKVTSYEDLPRLWNATTGHSEPLRIKVLTYNLYWWNLYDKHEGRNGSASILVAESGSFTPYDLMGFQECENIEWVLGDANLSDSYEFSEIHHSICVAWRNETWRRLDAGTDVVGTDGGWVRNNKWGDRIVSWVRLEHTETGDKVFFANHHGPLPLNSGGECGGLATAHNLLSAIKAHAKERDIIVLVGDFNSDYRSATVKMVSTRLDLGYHGESFGGIDNIFANTGNASFSHRENLGGAGSDHDALTATIQVEPSASAVAAQASAEAAEEAEAEAAAERAADVARPTTTSKVTVPLGVVAMQPSAAEQERKERGGAGRPAAPLAAPLGALAGALLSSAAA